MESPPERIEDDPRLSNGIRCFNEGEFFEAGEEFEGLFFEAIRDEVDFVRVLLQVSVGIHHVERGQLRAAVERLEEAIRIIRRVADSRGWDFDSLATEIRRLIPEIERRAEGDRRPIAWPTIRPTGPS